MWAQRVNVDALTEAQLAACIDHTVLKPETSLAQSALPLTLTLTLAPAPFSFAFSSLRLLSALRLFSPLPIVTLT